MDRLDKIMKKEVGHEEHFKADNCGSNNLYKLFRKE